MNAQTDSLLLHDTPSSSRRTSARHGARVASTHEAQDLPPASTPQDLPPAAPADEGEPGTAAELARCLVQLRLASARQPAQGGLPARARQLLLLCEQLQVQRESIMHAGWLSGHAPWDQHLDFDAGLAALRQLAQEITRDWADGELLPEGDPQALDRGGQVWAAQVLGRAEGVDLLVLGLHRPCAHLLLGFARAWLAGRACLVLSPDAHPLLDALTLAVRRGLPHGGAMLRWRVGADIGEALRQLQAGDHLQVWSTPVCGELRWEQLQDCAADRLLQLAAPGLAVLDEDVEPRSPLFEQLADLVALGLLALQGLHEHAVRTVWLPRALQDAFLQALRQRWLAWQGSRPAQHWQGGAETLQRRQAQSWIQDALAQGARQLAGPPQLPVVV
ncbi:MAG TPA: hypothetical protein VK195_02980, partial [Burkholderiaceae bacterium]|nr:hypothetical protein [Burkholderiaceae bacterium]